MRRVFISGGTGFIGGALIPELLGRGHQIHALSRHGSENRLPPGVSAVLGDALNPDSIPCANCDTFVHLVGTPHPAPWKIAEFYSVDLRSLKASVTAATRGGVKHFVFLSVAHPAPVMRAYWEVRAEGERIVRESGMAATFLRPWYVLGKGRSWPLFLKPLYSVAERVPKYRPAARRLGFVTLSHITQSLVWSVENPPLRVQIFEVPQIVTFSQARVR